MGTVAYAFMYLQFIIVLLSTSSKRCFCYVVHIVHKSSELFSWPLHVGQLYQPVGTNNMIFIFIHSFIYLNQATRPI